MWLAITAAPKDKVFFESNLDLIDDIVSRAVKSKHPSASQISRTHAQAWQRHTTQALGTYATLLSPTPAVSITFCDPHNMFKDVDNAHKNLHVVSRLTSVNTSPFARKCKDNQWVFPEESSVSRAIETGRGDGRSRRASSGRFMSVNPQSLARWLEEVNDDGYSGDEAD